MSDDSRLKFLEKIRYDLQAQRCKVCWNADGFDFNVPDDIWEEVVPKELVNRVVCLRCFDLLALERGIDYERHLKTVYFAGLQASFELGKVARERP